MSEYKITKTGENQYKVEEIPDTDWDSGDDKWHFCPVCGKKYWEYIEGYGFCSSECKEKYEENPSAYIKAPSNAGLGFIVFLIICGVIFAVLKKMGIL